MDIVGGFIEFIGWVLPMGNPVSQIVNNET